MAPGLDEQFAGEYRVAGTVECYACGNSHIFGRGHAAGKDGLPRLCFSECFREGTVYLIRCLVVNGGKDVIYIESGSPYLHLFGIVDKGVVGKQFIDEHAFCARKGGCCGCARLSREMHGPKRIALDRVADIVRGFDLGAPRL